MDSNSHLFQSAHRIIERQWKACKIPILCQRREMFVKLEGHITIGTEKVRKNRKYKENKTLHRYIG